jgi:hypothetical protein
MLANLSTLAKNGELTLWDIKWTNIPFKLILIKMNIKKM